MQSNYITCVLAYYNKAYASFRRWRFRRNTINHYRREKHLTRREGKALWNRLEQIMENDCQKS